MHADAPQPSDTPAADAAPTAVGAPTHVSAQDITLLICLRAHDGNPWVLSRLELIGDHYDPAPQVRIVDFGSAPDHAARIAEICARRGYDLLQIPDHGTFSLSAARNRGFEATTTPFVYFCDIDMFGYPDLFAQLARDAQELNMREVVDLVFNPPIHHLGEAVSARIEAEPDRAARGALLKQAGFAAGFDPADAKANHFTAPYSNAFLIRRDMFSMVGGYDERFRGHGSEDFEFLVRLAVHTGHLPLPEDLREDLYGPMKEGYFRPKPYRGFRRLLELASRPAADLGHKIFHLWHPRGTAQAADDWYGANDWKRSKLNDAFDAWLDAPHRLLGVDHLTRGRKLAVLCRHAVQWSYFTPLRLAGWELVPVFDTDPDAVAALEAMIENDQVQGAAIFNPYMKSHSAFRPAFERAREKGLETIVIERGALPGSIYYADDVAYASQSFSEDAFAAESFTPAELARARDDIATLRAGGATLEAMDGVEASRARWDARLAPGGDAHSDAPRPIVFLPLQLSDDMAVCFFQRHTTSYAEFAAGIAALAAANPGFLFVVKAHPLSGGDAPAPGGNLLLADRQDNVHFLLDLADLTLCYNSGVGLLSILHGTPTATLGNAFYNLCGAGMRAQTPQAALDAFAAGALPPPDPDLAARLMAWFDRRKYSSFIASDDIRVMKTRSSHGYRDILVTRLRLGGGDWRLDRLRRIAPFHWRGHAAVSAGIFSPHGAFGALTARELQREGIAALKHGEIRTGLRLYLAAIDRDRGARGRAGYVARYLAKAMGLRKGPPGLKRG